MLLAYLNLYFFYLRVQNDLKGIFSPKTAKRAPAKPFVYSLIDASSNDNKVLFVLNAPFVVH